MKRTLTVCFATVLLTTGLAKATAEPALKLHFAGIENLIQREDAKTLKAVWTQKETRTLRTEALGKLARHLAAQSGKGVSIFNSILPDIGLGETYLTIAPGERNPDVTFMAAMSKTRGGEWHSHRFKTIPSYDEDEERAVLQRLVDLFLAHGACGVETRLYDLARRPPQMPSSFSGANPGKSLTKARFQLVWPSYALHLLVHSAVWADVERYERATTSAFDFVAKMRADAGWLPDAPAPGVTLEGSAVVVKECLDWGGLNDKLAIVPRKYAAPWMRLLEAYYDDVAADYKNSEQFQLRLAHAFHVPVRKEPTALAMQDFYFWLPDARGRPGCFPWNYAGLKPNGHCLCVADRECAAVGDRLCAGQRPLGNDARPGA